MKRTILPLVGIAISLSSTAAMATWSIIAVDTNTREIAIGSATCISREQFPGIDLRMLSPAVAVGRGAGAAQSAIDGSGARRQTMFNGFLSDLNAGQILTQLEADPGLPSQQHGIVGSGESSATQTGTTNGPHASGMASSDQGIYYAVQGNVITGASVVSEAVTALLSTPGALPEKLMAAMQAARTQGGDGRCSCGPNADACGAPPPAFTKSAHVGYMIVARVGDTDDAVCNNGGCADGDYYMNFNVADQPAAADDPVAQLQVLFDNWRTGLIGEPDGLESTVMFAPAPGGFTMTIALADYLGDAITIGGATVTVQHDVSSDSLTAIGVVTDENDGTYTVPLTLNGGGPGVDRFLITINDGSGRDVVIAPNLTSLNVLDPDIVFLSGFEG